MASEEEEIRGGGDKRQETIFKASSEAHSVDSGGSGRDDKRRDHPSGAWRAAAERGR